MSDIQKKIADIRAKIKNPMDESSPAMDPEAMGDAGAKSNPSVDALDLDYDFEFERDMTNGGGTQSGTSDQDEHGEDVPGSYKNAEVKMQKLSESEKAFLGKKANVCLKIAEKTIPNGNKTAMINQAADLMYLPDEALIRMAERVTKSQVADKIVAERKTAKKLAEKKQQETIAKKTSSMDAVLSSLNLAGNNGQSHKVAETQVSAEKEVKEEKAEDTEKSASQDRLASKMDSLLDEMSKSAGSAASIVGTDRPVPQQPLVTAGMQKTASSRRDDDSVLLEQIFMQDVKRG